MDWLLWFDIETRWVDETKENMLQLACVLTNLTDDNVHYTREFRWVQGNISEKREEQYILPSRFTDNTIQLRETDKEIVQNLNQHLKVKDNLYLAGKTVQYEKQFIDKYMPLLSGRLSHMIVDVSTISIVCRNLAPEIYQRLPIYSRLKLCQPQTLHNAMQYIIESINEYKYYRLVFLVNTKTIGCKVEHSVVPLQNQKNENN